ncbi:MAG: DJ-1 family glyoxalase III [Lachnospiraceae bacterium]|jgi:4-methyl-5(b-hydroxyethyl)-thiazole monophosphate biosynthesis
MAKASVFLADGFEEIEGLTVVDLMRRAGIDVEMVSILDGLMVVGSHEIHVKADCTLKDFREEEAQMLILPGGGVGTKNLTECTELHACLKRAQEQGKYLGAICAAPSILGKLGLLKGKKAVCYPGFEDCLEGAEVLQDPVMIDGKVITSRGMGTAILFGLALIEVLQGKEAADHIKDSIIFN